MDRECDDQNESYVKGEPIDEEPNRLEEPDPVVPNEALDEKLEDPPRGICGFWVRDC